MLKHIKKGIKMSTNISWHTVLPTVNCTVGFQIAKENKHDSNVSP